MHRNVSNKLEQCVNINFLIKLGKNEHEIYHLLRKAYQNHCLPRAYVLKHFNEYSKINLEQQSKVEKTENMDVDTNNTDNTASSSSTHRGRSNSVIDSSCFRNSTILGTSKVRSRSMSTTDYYMSTEEYQSYTDLYSAGTSQSNETKKADTTDAKANNFSLNKVSDSARPLKEPIIYTSVLKNADCYDMNHKNRGKCIIFNHEKFDLTYDVREGSSLDAKRLQVTFTNLGFDVEIYNDFTHGEILDKINKVSQLDHTDSDCLCVIALTHGVQNDLICARDVIYKSDTLWKSFTADKCTTLAGKPKLFIIQACRGDESDSGIILSPRTLTKTETDSIISYAIPTHADFLIAHSSIQGFFTWRNPLEGTWYIQCLCDILDQYGTTMDLMNILTLTARKVATDFSSVNTDNLSLHNKKQVPSVTTMLIRTVYFPPKPN